MVLLGKFWNLPIEPSWQKSVGWTLESYDQPWLQVHSLVPGLSARDQILSHAPATMICDVSPYLPTMMD